MEPEKDLSLEEVDAILSDLEASLDTRTGEGITVFEGRDSSEVPISQSDPCLLRFEFPSAIWQEFTNYCKRNELDPAQQIREAIIAYYRNLWQTYRIRRKLSDDSELV